MVHGQSSMGQTTRTFGATQQSNPQLSPTCYVKSACIEPATNFNVRTCVSSVKLNRTHDFQLTQNTAAKVVSANCFSAPYTLHLGELVPPRQYDG